MQGIEMPRVHLKNVLVDFLGLEEFTPLMQANCAGQLGTEIDLP